MNKQKHVPANFAAHVLRELKSEGANPALSLKVQTLFTRLSRASAGRQTAIVESAVPLTGEEKRAMVRKISAVAGSPVLATYQVKPELLTGFRLSVGDILFDTSGLRAISHMSSALSA